MRFSLTSQAQARNLSLMYRVEVLSLSPSIVNSYVLRWAVKVLSGQIIHEIKIDSGREQTPNFTLLVAIRLFFGGHDNRVRLS